MALSRISYNIKLLLTTLMVMDLHGRRESYLFAVLCGTHWGSALGCLCVDEPLTGLTFALFQFAWKLKESAPKRSVPLEDRNSLFRQQQLYEAKISSFCYLLNNTDIPVNFRIYQCYILSMRSRKLIGDFSCFRIIHAQSLQQLLPFRVCCQLSYHRQQQPLFPGKRGLKLKALTWAMSSQEEFRHVWVSDISLSRSLLSCHRDRCPARFQQGTSVMDWFLPQYLLLSFLTLLLTSVPALEVRDLSSSRQTSLLTRLSAGHKLSCQCSSLPCRCCNPRVPSSNPRCPRCRWAPAWAPRPPPSLLQKLPSSASVTPRSSLTRLLPRWPTTPLPPPSARARARAWSWPLSSRGQECLVTWPSRLLWCRGSPGPSCSPSWHLHSPNLFLWPVLGRGPNSHKK